MLRSTTKFFKSINNAKVTNLSNNRNLKSKFPTNQSRFFSTFQENKNENKDLRNAGFKLLNSLQKENQITPFYASKNIKWYTCGPTVYDHSHIGHARTYVGVDILQRIIRDYFNFEITHAMNITDVDDKILKRCEIEKVERKEFTKLYEDLFFQEMNYLNVQKPKIVTRVSEHIKEIQEMISTILKHGFAYVGKDTGSIYFDVSKYGSSYGVFRDSSLIKPNLVEADQQEENPHGEKKGARDFALWKVTNKDLKQAEIMKQYGWKSEWGFGRPGWHIECSAMCSSVFGKELDVHAGGVDLAFPHHENEIAQSLAAFYPNDTKPENWSRVFVHLGHVHINGLKMSKSLKNFITIKEMREKYGCSGDQFRIWCLQQPFHSNVEFSEERISDSFQILFKFKSFLERAKLVISQSRQEEEKSLTKWTEKEEKLAEIQNQQSFEIDSSLRNNFDTASVLRSLLNVVHSTTNYLNGSKVDLKLIKHSYELVSTTLSMFGITLKDAKTTTENNNNDILEIESKLELISNEEIEKLISQRKTLKLEKKWKDADKIRDSLFENHSIILTDLPTGTTWNRVDKKQYLQSKQIVEKNAERAAKRQEEVKEQKKSADPLSFKSNPNYSKFDSEGIPTHDKDGKEISNNQRKKLRKELEKQKSQIQQ